MIRLLAVVIISSVAAAAQSSVPVPPSNNRDAIPAPAVAPPSKDLPPPPPGKSTVIGGQIRAVDPVRDQVTLKVSGGNQTMKIFYDERTQVYRNGQRIPVLSLKPDDHASIETTLDGTQVFALRIHMLSTLPQGECRGQVINYNYRSGQLTVNASLSSEPIRLRVPAQTPVVRVGQKEFTTEQHGLEDLARGSLVDVTFQASARGEGVATHIDVLATPGSAFTFSGVISFLDMHAGRLVIVDPRDSQSYEFSFNPGILSVSRQLHEGSAVRVTANFDGSRYMASQITME
ncbi:MAG: hypothetical protein WA294_06460 [Acidobacteriaceae bacterium]